MKICWLVPIAVYISGWSHIRRYSTVAISHLQQVDQQYLNQAVAVAPVPSGGQSRTLSPAVTDNTDFRISRITEAEGVLPWRRSAESFYKSMNGLSTSPDSFQLTIAQFAPATLVRADLKAVGEDVLEFQAPKLLIREEVCQAPLMINNLLDSWEKQLQICLRTWG